LNAIPLEKAATRGFHWIRVLDCRPSRCRGLVLVPNFWAFLGSASANVCSRDFSITTNDPC
jgi:hypothetical protein